MCEWSGGAHSKAEVNGEGLGGAGRVRWEGWVGHVITWPAITAAITAISRRPKAASGLPPLVSRLARAVPLRSGPKLGRGSPWGPPLGLQRAGPIGAVPAPPPGSGGSIRAAKGIGGDTSVNHVVGTRNIGCDGGIWTESKVELIASPALDFCRTDPVGDRLKGTETRLLRSDGFARSNREIYESETLLGVAHGWLLRGGGYC